MQKEFEGKIDALHDVIKNKDETIGKLYSDIGELKQTCKEIDVLKKSCNF